MKQNGCLVGPAGTGTGHPLASMSRSATPPSTPVDGSVDATASELVDILYRRLADNAVGTVIDHLLQVTLVIVDETGCAPIDDAGAHLFVRLTAAICQHVPLKTTSHRLVDQGDGFCPSSPPPSAFSAGCCTTASWSSPTASPAACAKPARAGVLARRETLDRGVRGADFQ